MSPLLPALLRTGEACIALPFHQSATPEGETNMRAEESHALQPGPTVSADLRWCCDEAWLPFASTDEVEPLTGVVGQDAAIEALRFGLEISGPGPNIFVRGLPGTGRLSLVRQLLDALRPT